MIKFVLIVVYINEKYDISIFMVYSESNKLHNITKCNFSRFPYTLNSKKDLTLFLCKVLTFSITMTDRHTHTLTHSLTHSLTHTHTHTHTHKRDLM